MNRALLAVVLSSVALGQSAPPAFDIADVHVSPRADWVKKGGTQMQGGLLNAGRYELRRATMLDLIRTAYSVDADKIYGGPSWIDYDRFEVIAKAPASTRPAELKLMLQSLLADRFKLAVKKDTKPMPAYVLSAGKGQPKLKPAEGSASGGCQSPGLTVKADVPYTSLQCRGVTMEAFAPALRRFAPGSFANLPVADGTGIEGTWDIDLDYPLLATPVNGGLVTGGSVIEAVEKQLGLKLERGEVPQPVLVVESANEQPTANPPGVAAALPPLPPLEFEVASIRPCDGTANIAPRFESGGRVTARCMYLGNLVRQLWGLAPFEELVGAPKWLTGDGQPSFSIEAKAPAGNYVDAQGAPDRDALNAMMRALLVDRYQIKLHYEDRPMDAYTLVALTPVSAKPKLTKADPANRTGCTRQNQQQQGRALLVRLVCQNMTMAQFAEQIQAYDPDIYYPVLDTTGIDGAWDFTLNYDAMANLNVRFPGRGAAAGPDAQAADPSGAVSFVDSIEKQLGLKLEKHKRPVNVLVIDHIEEKQTDN